MFSHLEIECRHDLICLRVLVNESCFEDPVLRAWRHIQMEGASWWRLTVVKTPDNVGIHRRRGDVDILDCGMQATSGRCLRISCRICVYLAMPLPLPQVPALILFIVLD